MTTGIDPPEVVAWHDAECGAYTADLELWDELARAAPGPVLELGSGTGRVALHLARAGHEVIAVERDPELAAELERRAAAAGLGLTVVAADIRDLGQDSIVVSPPLVIAPMHVVQTLEPTERKELVVAAAHLLAPGGALALAIIDESHSSELASGDPLLLPDVSEVDGWVFSSQPLWVQISEEAITARRLRERVAPDGELQRSVHDDVLYRTQPADLELLGAELGLAAHERRHIRSGPIESDSIVVLLEAP